MRVALLIALAACTSAAPSSAPDAAPAAVDAWAGGRRIVAVVGQSNAEGMAVGSAPASTLLLKQAVSDGPGLVWSEPLTATAAPRTDGRWGVEMGMSGDFAITKFAQGNSGLEAHWLADYPAGEVPYRARMLRWLDESERELDGELVAFVWIQGEKDAKLYDSASRYGANLARLVALIRERYPRAVFIFNRLSSQNVGAYTALVRAGQESVTSAVMIDCDDLPTDGTHFTAAGYLELGERIVAVLP